MTVNKDTIDLIKRWEGFRPDAYKCPAGVWTIGYGTTASAGAGITPRAGMVIDEAQAEVYLRRTVDKFAATIRPMITAPVTDNQFGAMVSLAYNIGPSAFGRSSVLGRFNRGDIQGAADAFRMWNKAGGRVLQGLVNRREDEIRLFLTSEPATAKQSPWAALIAAVAALFRKGS